MRMNRIETVLVNSAPRRWLQRAVETPVLLRLGGRMAGGTALELGCGQGAGIELILDKFVAVLEDHDLRVGDRHHTLIAGGYALGVAERVPLRSA